MNVVNNLQNCNVIWSAYGSRTLCIDMLLEESLDSYLVLDEDSAEAVKELKGGDDVTLD